MRARAIDAAAKPAPFDLDRIAAAWQRALDAADRALIAAPAYLPAAEIATGRARLGSERTRTAQQLLSLGRLTGARSAPWLSPVPVSNGLLGLAPTVRACLFDLDGVLTDSGVLHAMAWAEVFDEFLVRVSERAGRHFMRFDRSSDYGHYLDGRPRLEGIHLFLASRGIRLPEGRLEDRSTAETAYGLARRKSEALGRFERQRGVNALTGARRYLQATGYAGLQRAVVSASASTLPMLELAGLASLVESHVDADVFRTEQLRSRPAPDVLLAVCRRLGVPPEAAVTFTHSPEGVAAGHAAGLAVVGVGPAERAELLRGFGAERIAPTLGALLDGRLAA